MKLRTLTHPNATSCGWLDSERLLTAGSDKLARIWDVNGGVHTSAISLGTYAEQVATHSGVAYIGQSDGAVTDTSGHTFPTFIGRITELAIGGDRIAAGGVSIGSAGNTITQLAMFSRNGTHLWSRATGNMVYGLAFSPGGEFIFVGEGSGVISRRSASTGDVLASRGAFSNSIVDLRPYKSGVWAGQLNSTTNAPSLWLLDGQTLAVVAQIGHVFTSGVWSIGLNADETKLGVTGNRNELVVFDRASGTPIYNNPSGSIGKKIAWHPTRPDFFALCTSEGTIELHNLEPEVALTSPMPPAVVKPGKRK